MPSIRSLRTRSAGLPGAAIVALLCGTLAAPANALQNAPVPTAVPEALAEPEAVASPPLNTDQLEALVAPIALYPDPLLAQCLVASTYPIDLVSAQQWLDRNPNLKGADLAAAAEKQPWDPSVQALVAIPDALKRMSENVEWTTDLGDAFLAQENEVMDAVQRLRVKAKESGKLESTEQQNVEVTSADDQTVIEIQPASTEVVYVPSYSPSVIWGVGVYPYPPIYYPPYYGGAWLGFGLGIAIGIGISGGWGWGCGWGGNNNITINNNNNYVNHHNRQNNINRSGNSNWQHNAQQRGGTPYKDRATAQKYGGQGGARGGDFDRSRSGGGASGLDRGGSGGFDRGSSGLDRGGSSSNRMGSRDISSGSRGGGAFGGSQSGNWARSTSSRGSSSMGGMRGGGMRGGGGRRR
jgi:hypothetical protein